VRGSQVNQEKPGIDRGDTSILFVCLGNICRSPLAEGVFLALADEEGTAHRFRVDSAGTGSWHIGEPPDARAVSVARARGIRLDGRARRITEHDLDDFDWIIAMDRSNRSAIRALVPPRSRARIHLLREFDPVPGDPDVPDPYYGGPGGFEEVFDIVDRCCRKLLEHLDSPPR
jgi:protein-tyrosine phosphatase